MLDAMYELKIPRFISRSTYLLDDTKGTAWLEYRRFRCFCGWPNQLARLERLLVDQGVNHHAPVIK